MTFSKKLRSQYTSQIASSLSEVRRPSLFEPFMEFLASQLTSVYDLKWRIEMFTQIYRYLPLNFSWTIFSSPIQCWRNQYTHTFLHATFAIPVPLFIALNFLHCTLERKLPSLFVLKPSSCSPLIWAGSVTHMTMVRSFPWLPTFHALGPAWKWIWMYLSAIWLLYPNSWLHHSNIVETIITHAF